MKRHLDASIARDGAPANWRPSAAALGAYRVQASAWTRWGNRQHREGRSFSEGGVGYTFR